MSFTVAIDGPAAAGKGTLAKQLAAHFKMAHLDTGLLYRAVARQVLAGCDPVSAAVSLQAADRDPTGLYTSEVAQQARQGLFWSLGKFSTGAAGGEIIVYYFSFLCRTWRNLFSSAAKTLKHTFVWFHPRRVVGIV